MKAIIDQKAQVSPVEMYTVIDFYLRCSLEAVSMVKRSLSSKLDFYDDKIMILWGVYSRTPILEVINGVLQLLLNDQQNQSVPERLHNMIWKLISKLAKGKLIFKEHLVTYWPEAVRQLSQLFGITSSERLPTIVSFLSTLMSLKPEDLPFSDKISIVQLVLQKVHEQAAAQNGADDGEDDDIAHAALGEFFDQVAEIFLRVMTASGRNYDQQIGFGRASRSRPQFNEFEFDDDDDRYQFNHRR